MGLKYCDRYQFPNWKEIHHIFRKSTKLSSVSENLRPRGQGSWYRTVSVNIIVRAMCPCLYYKIFDFYEYFNTYEL